MFSKFCAYNLDLETKLKFQVNLLVCGNLKIAVEMTKTEIHYKLNLKSANLFSLNQYFFALFRLLPEA